MAASIHCLRCLALALLLSCLGTCCSARSLSSTGAGGEPATAIRHLQQQEQQADCPQCTSCPNVYGYTGYRNARPLGEDVMQGDIPMRAGSVTLPQLAQLCNHSCTCEAFSSTGSFKTSANMSANSLTDDSCFYVRNSPPLPCSDCPPVPGYRAYPSYDHYWDDLSTKLPKVFNLSDIASLCDEDCACKGFNVFSWSNARTFDTANKKSLVFPMHSSAWTGAYFCLYEKLVLSAVCPDDTCPEAPGYTAIRGVDHEGDNLHVATNLYDRVVDGTGSGSPDMAFMCNSSCTCRGFSSTGDGYLKTNATPNANSTGTCLYQRIALPPACPVCPALEGFDAVVGYDTIVGYDPTPGYNKPVALLDAPPLLNATSLAAAGALCLQDCRCRGLSFNTSLSADALAANFSAAVSLKSLAMPILPAQGMCFYVRQGAVNFCTALAPTPANVTGSTSSSSDSSSGGSNTAAIVGGVVGGVLGAVLLAAAIIGLVLWRRKSKRGGGWFGEAGKPLMPAPSSHALGKLHKSLHLPPGDGFLMDIAPYFTWLDTTPADAYPLEAGVTAPEADTEEVVQLSGVQVMQELELLADGMLGKGATAMVFKCRMPKRFGPQALLAAKVMRVAQGAELQYMMSSFEYEAELLKRCRHPGVVRLYAYCLEPPCACLIMELLPTSLKDRLHGLEPGQQANLTTTVGKGSLTSPTKHTTTTSTTVTVTGMDTQRTAMSSSDNTNPYNEHTNRGRDRDASTTFSSTNNATPFGVDAELQKYDSGLNKYDSGVLSPASLASPVTARVHTLRSRRMSCVSSIVTSYGAPLSMLEVLQLSTSIAAGLAHLHAKPSPEEDAPQEDSKAEHVVHRDLKPANILLNSLGQAKITDFGLARGHQNTTVYTDHVGAGTLRYMAPEIITSGMDSKLTNKVDIYSLGIMMWELTAHQRPWPGCTEANIPLLVTSGQRPATPGYPSADSQAPAAAPAVESLQEPATFSAVPAYTALIHECWDADPTRRPDAASVHRRLKALLEELHIDLDQDMSPNDV